MNFELFLSIRQLRAKRNQSLVSINTLISMTGIMMGVMALIVVLSVANGYRYDMLSKTMGVDGHICVKSTAGLIEDHRKPVQVISGIKGVIAATPIISSEILIARSGNIAGAYLRGLDTASAGKVSDIDTMIEEGTLASLDSLHEELPAIIVGCELAKEKGLSVGDVITIFSTYGKSLKSTPKRKYKVTALFRSGLYDYDRIMVFVSLKEAQNFFDIGSKVTGIDVKINDIAHTEPVMEAIKEIFAHQYFVQDWKGRNSVLLSFLELYKTMMFIIITMVVLVGSLSIVGALLMLVKQKSRDIAILMAMGASKKSIINIFMIQGIIIGITGIAAGLLSGLGICYILKKYNFIELDSSLYGVAFLSVKVETFDILMVTLSAFIIALLSTVYPSWYASRQDPIEILRYE